MSEDRNFFSRWSRRKHEAAREQAKPAEQPQDKPAPQAAARPPAPPPELPSPDSLTFDSDFSAYLAANVEESVRRAALKKLFSDPRFNVMDGLDVYIDDYTKNDPIPDEMLKKLEHARSTFAGLERPKAEPKSDPAQGNARAADNETPQPQEAKDPGRGDPGQDA